MEPTTMTSPSLPPQIKEPRKYELKKLAVYQRLLMFALLSGFIPLLIGIVIHPLGFLLLFAALGFQIYALGGLAKQIGWSPWLVVLGLFVPALNLIIMLVGSDTATKQLKKAGVKVGFLGVSSKQLREAEAKGII